MDRLSVFSEKLGMPLEVSEEMIGDCIVNLTHQTLEASWMNNGWSNYSSNWINSGWNNYSGSWSNSGWNNYSSNWSNGGWSNYSGGK